MLSDLVPARLYRTLEIHHLLVDHLLHKYLGEMYNVFVYGCNVTQGQLWLSQGALDVMVILLGIRTCTLDVLVISCKLFG